MQDVLARLPKREGQRGSLEVDIGLLVPSNRNPRRNIDEQQLRELAESIRQHGIIQPIVVLRRDVGYEILSGERRWRAAQIAGLTKVPVVIREEQDPRHQAELRLVENIQRADLNPIELAQAYQALITEHGLTHDELAARLNKDRSTITNTLRLLQLAPEVQALVSEGRLSAGHARALLAVEDPQRQRALAERILAEQLPVRLVERLVKRPEAAGQKPTKSPNIKELEENLRVLFGSRVSIREQNGKGSITVRFTSKEHYLRVVAVLERVIRQANLERAGLKS
ncbi:MAG: ParB/RepB/Spo0J family partition protein [Planctomycetota bacterium]|nr:ParB/RepB/Spo0J family partition protein [Planctomycetota bacterium]